MPTIGSCAFWADQGSVTFDRKMHSYGGGAKILEDFRRWKAMSTSEKTVTIVKDNKYKILIGTWLGSLYGKWAYVENNRIMDATQKAVRIKNFGIASTGILALGMFSLIMNGRYPKSQSSSASKE